MSRRFRKEDAETAKRQYNLWGNDSGLFAQKSTVGSDVDHEEQTVFSISSAAQMLNIRPDQFHKKSWVIQLGQFSLLFMSVTLILWNLLPVFWISAIVCVPLEKYLVNQWMNWNETFNQPYRYRAIIWCGSTKKILSSFAINYWSKVCLLV